MVSIFDIIDTHESKKVRDLALEHFTRFLPQFKREQVLELWITHPLPSLKSTIQNMVNSHKDRIKTPILIATYIMLGEYEKVQMLDPDFLNIDTYLQGMNPLFGSLLVERVINLKSMKSKSISTISEDKFKLSIVELLGRREFHLLWESIFSYTFPFVCELLKTFEENNFIPKEAKSRDIYENLIELIGYKGWKLQDGILLNTVSIFEKDEEGFRPLTQEEKRAGVFTFEITSEIYTRPDRILTFPFVSYGRNNLISSEIGLYLYESKIRYSKFTGLIYIPIYSVNGFQLIEIQIPATSEHAFNMDEDGKFFTISAHNNLYSFDIDVLALFVLPLNQLTEFALENVSILLENAEPSYQSILQGLQTLLELHLGRSFTLLKTKETLEFAHLLKSKCCALGVDFGNFSTKLSIIPSNCDHEIFSKEYPTLIHYSSTVKYIVGQEVLDSNLKLSKQSFTNIKRHIISSSTYSIRIQNTTINSLTAGSDFLKAVLQDFLAIIKFSPQKIAYSYPEFSLNNYRVWLFEICSQFTKGEVFAYEDTTAILNYTYRINKVSGNTVLVDIGDMHTTVTVANIPKNKNRKRLLKQLLIEPQEPIKAICRRFAEEGANVINKVIEQIIMINFGDAIQESTVEVAELLKFDLVENFETEMSYSTPNPKTIKFYMGEVEGTGVDLFLQSTEYFSKFKQTLRDALFIAEQRNLSSDGIVNVLISGNGNKWPIFSKYVYDTFSKKQTPLFEDDQFNVSLGLGILANSQEISGISDFDIALKVNKRGVIDYENILKRGDLIGGYCNIFKIDRKFSFTQLVLDIWLRKVVLNPTGKQPPNDNQIPNFSEKPTNTFLYDHLVSFPLVFDLAKVEYPLLGIGIDKTGWLVMFITSKEEQQQANNFVKIAPVN